LPCQEVANPGKSIAGTEHATVFKKPVSEWMYNQFRAYHNRTG
jgi:hypothetical protein